MRKAIGIWALAKAMFPTNKELREKVGYTVIINGLYYINDEAAYVMTDDECPPNH